MAEKGHTFEQAVNPLLQVEPRRSEETQRRATRHRSHRGAAAKCTYVGAALAHHREGVGQVRARSIYGGLV